MKPLAIVPDSTFNKFTNIVPLSDHNNYLILAAGVAKSVPIPSDARMVVFSTNIDFFVKEGSTVDIPSSDITDGSAATLNPYVVYLGDLDSLSIIAPTEGEVGLTYYA